jgi:hypothetical protein
MTLYLKHILIGLSLVTLPLHARPLILGPSTSGGNGYALVCRDNNKQIIRAQLLDLFEAGEKYQLSLPAPMITIAMDYIRGVRNTYRLQGRTEALDENNILNDLNEFFVRARFMNHVVAISDLGEVDSPPQGCAFEPVAYFHDDRGIIDINAQIWAVLDSLNRAALVSHELFYHVDRELNDHTSEATRATVAHIYSDSDLATVMADLPADAKEYGAQGSAGNAVGYTSFRAYRDDQGVTLQFFTLMNRPLVTKTTVQIPGIAFSLNSQCVVTEKGQNRDQVLPLEGSQFIGMNVEIVYQTGKSVRLSLLERGVPVMSAEVNLCP